MKKHTIFFIGLMSLFISLQAQFTYDAQAVYPLVPSEYSQTPLSQVISLDLSANVENAGTANITNVKLGIKVWKDGALLTTLQSSNTVATILPNSANSFSISYLLASGAGLYTFKYYPILAESDQSTANDTSETAYNISISDYTRHLGTAVDGYGIGTGDGDALIGSLFTVNNAKLLDKIKVDLFTPTANTNVKARIYATTNGIPNNPATPLWESDVVTIFAAGAQSINFFSNNMPTLAPGTYWFGCLELDNGMSIAEHTSIFTPNRQYVYWDNVPGGTWVTLESQTPINYTLAITPVFDLACTPGASPVVAITGSTNDSIIVCNGTPVTLTCSATGVSEYRWFRNDTLISSVNGGNGSLVVNAGKMESGVDIYTLKVLYTALECLSASSMPLKVKNYVPLATITTNGASTFCEIKPAPTTTLTANEGVGYNYVWQLAGDTVQSSGITHTPISSGAYTVIVTDPQGCSNTSSPTTITILTHPAAPSIAITGSATNTISVCSNVNVVLNSVTGGGTMTEYVWHKNNVPLVYYNGGTGKYTANSGYGPWTDTYNLEVAYAGNQCISLMSAPISVVNISPVTNVTPSGSLTFCVNAPVPIVATANTGYTYVWKRSTTIVQVGGVSYTPTAAGSHTVTVTQASTGCVKISLPVVVSIQALPTANAGVDKSVCFGETVAIGTAALGTNTYTWSPSAGLSNPYTAMPNASPTISTSTYTVTVRDAIGCSKTDAMVVTNLPLPATPSLASTASSVCQGTNVSLTPTSIGAASLNWYKNGVLQYNKATTFVQVVNTPSATASNYTVKAKGTNACLSSFSNYQNVWVKEAAIPTITSTPAAVGTTITVCVPGGTSGSALLTANSTTASPIYAWKVGASFVTGANSSTYSQTVTPTSNNKVVRVQATYPNGCVQTSATRTVTLVTTGCVATKLGADKDGTSDLIDAALSVGVYPNPTNDKLQVAIAHSTENEGKILVFNSLGQTVLTQTISLINGEANIELDFAQLAAGVYSLTFQTATSNNVQKIVKQ